MPVVADYQIVSRIVVQDASAPGTSAAQRGLQQVEAEGRRVGLSLTGILGRAFATIGGAAGVGLLVRGISRLGSEVEGAAVGIASLFNVTTGTPMERSLLASRSLIRDLRADADQGVGEFTDYAQAFQMIWTPSAQAGAQLGQVRELNRLVIAAGAALRGQEGMQLAPLDIVQALTGGAGERVTPFVNQALRAMGVSLEQFNAMDQGKRFDTLLQAFRAFGPAVEVFGRTFEAQVSTARDNLKGLVRDITQPLFERWTDQIRGFNKRFAESEGAIGRVVDVWGPRMVALWDHLIANARTYASILAGAALVQAVPAGAGGGLRNVATAAAFSFGAGGGGLGGVGRALATALGPLVPVVTRLIAPLAVVTTGISAVTGALAEFGGLSVWLSEMGAFLSASFGQLTTAFGTLTAEGSALNLVGSALVGILGGLAFVAGVVVRGLAALVVGLGVVFRAIGAGVQVLYYTVTGQVGKANAARELFGSVFTEGNDQLRRLIEPTVGERVHGGDDKGPALDKLDKTKQVTNIGTVNVRVEREVNADPGRVAATFDEVLERVLRNPRQAQRSPVPTFAR